MTKTEFRTHAKNIIAKQNRTLNTLVVQKLNQLIKKIHIHSRVHKHVHRILTYIPLKNEPNLRKLAEKNAKKREFFSTFMQNKSLKIVKLRRPFTKAKFGVLQSSSVNAFRGKIDIAIVPVIGVDGSGGRIGHGMGFYDRLFGGLNYRPIVIFVGGVKSDKIFCEQHDLVCDFYITPNKTFKRIQRCGKSSQLHLYR